MVSEKLFSVEGGCACGSVRYRMTAPPLFVHCCHCRWCQRESGAGFAINALIEASQIELLKGEPVQVDTPSESGRGQIFSRCPKCSIALWSNYAGMGEKVRFIRVGTLDNPDLAPPDIHIYTASKQPWILLDEDTPSCTGYYDRKAYWPDESMARWKVLRS